jgi:2-polyprenyl-6-methoxyphenol hydroxylase-like FAD-dependent oxidoreductase
VAAVGKAVIVGGGVGGLTAALALQRAGVAVEVHERHPGPQLHATGFVIWTYAIKLLTDLGVPADELEKAGSPVEQTEIRDQEGKLLATMPVGEVSRKLGAPSYEMQRAGLLAAIAGRLSPGTVRWSSECVGIEQGGESATALLADGSRAPGDVLIGADGIHSVTRRAVAGPAELRYSGYTGVGAVTAFTHPLLPPRHHVEIWGRGAKAGVADVGGARARWYLTHKVPPGAEGQVGKAEILARTAGWYELLRAAVEASDEGQFARSEAWDLPPLNTWVSGRVVLLGDAAHATTPFAAMGANMAIADACALAVRLTAGGDLGAALHAFQEERKAHTEEVVKHGRRMGLMSQLHSPILAWLRDQAFLHMPADRLEAVCRAAAAGE